MNRDQCRAILARSLWLTQAPPAFTDTVLGACLFRNLDDGAWAWGAGDQIGGPMAVVSGSIAIEMQHADGEFDLIWLLQRGRWFGISSIGMTRSRLATARAVGPTVVAQLPGSEVGEMTRADPEAWRWFALIPFLSADLAITVSTILMQTDSSARVAGILAELSRSGLVNDPEPCDICLPQEDLAHLCGVSRNTLSRELSRLEAQGRVATGYRRVRIQAAG